MIHVWPALASNLKKSASCFSAAELEIRPATDAEPPGMADEAVFDPRHLYADEPSLDGIAHLDGCKAEAAPLEVSIRPKR